MRGVLGAKPLGGLRQIQLDDLGGAGAHEEELADVRPARKQAVDLPVDLGLGIGHAGEVGLLEDRGAEARLGEDHHAGGRLQQMRAGARAHDQEEGVLHLAVQPNDAGQPAEDLALAALAQDGGVAAAAGRLGHRMLGHAAPPSSASRAARSFSRNCAALTT